MNIEQAFGDLNSLVRVGDIPTRVRASVEGIEDDDGRCGVERPGLGMGEPNLDLKVVKHGLAHRLIPSFQGFLARQAVDRVLGQAEPAVQPLVSLVRT